MFRKTIIATAVITTAMTSASATASSTFFDDAVISGGIYNMTRIRDRKANDGEEFAENIHHSTTMGNIDFSSGLIGGVFGVDAAVFGTWDMWNSGSSQWSEFSLVDEGEIKDGVSVYKAAFKMHLDTFKARAGYIQPSGPGVLGVNWSFMPGTYRGGEGVYSNNGLTVAYMWADEYKNPWTYDTEKMLKHDGSEMDYVHSLGASYDLGNGVSLLGAYGQGEDFIDLYKFKAAYDGEGYHVSYHFYGMDDKSDVTRTFDADGNNETNNIFDDLTYQHVLMSRFYWNNWTFRAEATYTKSEGSEHNFAFRPTGYNGGFGGSNGAYEVWWDSRSDFNHDGEKAVFFGGWYQFDHGWSAGASYAYGWGAESNDTSVTTDDLKEEAYNLDVGYTFQGGELKGASIKAHYTMYKLKTDVDSWSTAFPNAFRDDKDLKLSFVMPLSF